MDLDWLRFVGVHNDKEMRGPDQGRTWIASPPRYLAATPSKSVNMGLGDFFLNLSESEGNCMKLRKSV